MNISKQVAIVSGANRGLGKELALELLARGTKVYAGARNPESIDLPGAIPLQLDITDPQSVMAAAEVASDVTLLINNAGSATGASLLTGEPERYSLGIQYTCIRYAFNDSCVCTGDREEWGRFDIEYPVRSILAQPW